jgi:hydrogenase expression/formation protein HypC
MCIAIPGKIVSLDPPRAKVDFNGNLVEVNVGLIDPEIGDYVLVHAGCAIEIMEKDKALELIELFQDLEEFA